MLKSLLMGCLSMIVGSIITSICSIMTYREVTDATQRARVAVVTGRENLDRRYRFTPPEGRQLDSDDVEDFFDVRKKLGQKLTALQAPSVSVGDAAHPFTTLGKVLDHQMKDRVDALMKVLEAEEMSPREYVWTLQTVYGSVAAAAASGNGNAKGLLEDLEKAYPTGGLVGRLIGNVDAMKALGATGMVDLDTVALLEKRKAELIQPERVAEDAAVLALLGGT